MKFFLISIIIINISIFSNEKSQLRYYLNDFSSNKELTKVSQEIQNSLMLELSSIATDEIFFDRKIISELLEKKIQINHTNNLEKLSKSMRFHYLIKGNIDYKDNLYHLEIDIAKPNPYQVQDTISINFHKKDNTEFYINQIANKILDKSYIIQVDNSNFNRTSTIKTINNIKIKDIDISEDIKNIYTYNVTNYNLYINSIKNKTDSIEIFEVEKSNLEEINLISPIIKNLINFSTKTELTDMIVEELRDILEKGDKHYQNNKYLLASLEYKKIISIIDRIQDKEIKKNLNTYVNEIKERILKSKVLYYQYDINQINKMYNNEDYLKSSKLYKDKLIELKNDNLNNQKYFNQLQKILEDSYKKSYERNFIELYSSKIKEIDFDLIQEKELNLEKISLLEKKYKVIETEYLNSPMKNKMKLLESKLEERYFFLFEKKLAIKIERLENLFREKKYKDSSNGYKNLYLELSNFSGNKNIIKVKKLIQDKYLISNFLYEINSYKDRIESIDEKVEKSNQIEYLKIQKKQYEKVLLQYEKVDKKYRLDSFIDILKNRIDNVSFKMLFVKKSKADEKFQNYNFNQALLEYIEVWKDIEFINKYNHEPFDNLAQNIKEKINLTSKKGFYYINNKIKAYSNFTKLKKKSYSVNQILQRKKKMEKTQKQLLKTMDKINNMLKVYSVFWLEKKTKNIYNDLIQDINSFFQINYSKFDQEGKSIYKVAFKDKTAIVSRKGIIVEPSVLEFKNLDDGYTALKIDDKWVIVDKEYNFLTKVNIDSFRELKEGYIALQIDKKWAIIDSSYKFLTKANIEEIKELNNEFNLLKINQKWAVADKNYKLLTEPIYPFIRNVFKNGETIKTFQGHNSNVSSLEFSPDGTMIASSGLDRIIRLTSIKTGKVIHQLKGHKDEINDLSFSPDGKYLASASYDKTIKIWTIKTGKLLKTLKGHQKSVKSVAFSPDGQTLASGSYETIKLWSFKKGESLKTLRGHSYYVNSVTFSPNGKYLASASSGNNIKLWLSEGKLLHTFRGHTSSIFTILFSRDGKYLASGSYDNTIRLWSVDERKSLKKIESHKDSVKSLAFSPNNQILASGGGKKDKTIQIFSMQTGKLVKKLIGHWNAVDSLTFSPNGESLASGSYDYTIKTWCMKDFCVTK